MNTGLVPTEGNWYQDIDGANVFEVLNYDEDHKITLVRFTSGCVEEIDEECWSEMNLRVTESEDDWGDAHSHAFDIMEENDEIYNTDTLHFTLESDEEEPS